MTRAINTAWRGSRITTRREGQGWDRTFLAVGDPTQPEDFQGEAIGVRAGVASCLDCHITYPRAGRERIGPEAADRAIGCERCHGPGGNHLAAVAAGFSDRAIVNPASASPQAVTQKRCNDCHILDQRYRHGDPEKPGWVRSQGAGWTWSRCNTESGGAFGCVTCHDPHKGVRSTTTAQYEAKCLACHSAATVQPAGAARTGRSGLDRAETEGLLRRSGERVHQMPHARRADGLIAQGLYRPLHPHPTFLGGAAGCGNFESTRMTLGDPKIRGLADLTVCRLIGRRGSSLFEHRRQPGSELLENLRGERIRGHS